MTQPPARGLLPYNRGMGVRAGTVDRSMGSQVRKTVTIVFADLEDSTALGERLDPEVLRELQDALLRGHAGPTRAPRRHDRKVHRRRRDGGVRSAEAARGRRDSGGARRHRDARRDGCPQRRARTRPRRGAHVAGGCQQRQGREQRRWLHRRRRRQHRRSAAGSRSRRGRDRRLTDPRSGRGSGADAIPRHALAQRQGPAGAGVAGGWAGGAICRPVGAGLDRPAGRTAEGARHAAHPAATRRTQRPRRPGHGHLGRRESANHAC